MTLRLPAPLRTWYEGLMPRERRLVIAGGVFLVLLVFYLAVVSPLSAAHTRLMRDVQAKRQLLAYINNAAPRLEAQSGGSAGHLPPGQSVFAALSSAIQSSPISSAVQRLEQSSDGGVRLTLSGARFDDLATWLDSIQKRDGIVATRANIEQANDPGTVNATLTLNQHQ